MNEEKVKEFLHELEVTILDSSTKMKKIRAEIKELERMADENMIKLRDLI